MTSTLLLVSMLAIAAPTRYPRKPEVEDDQGHPRPVADVLSWKFAVRL